MNENTPELTIVQHLDFIARLKTLTAKELVYFSVMRSQYGVLFIKSKPGVAKSAIAKSIAFKLGLQYVDIRLSMADETDMQFPNLTFDKELKCHVIEHAIPEWAAMANEIPTLIHFEELNRAPLAVRNAALQILLERGIGPKFKFNKNVFMMSSGNLGAEDGTDVEEFDNALNNRLIHLMHDLTIEEWFDWGKANILHPDITSFIEYYPDYFYKAPNENSQTYASPRSWHMLSEFIIKNYGGGPRIDPSTVVMGKGKETGLPTVMEQDVYRHPVYKVGADGEFLLDEEDNKIVDTTKVGPPIHWFDGFKTKHNMNYVKDGLDRNWGDMADYSGAVANIAHGMIGDVAGMQFIKFLEERTRIALKDIINNYTKCKIELVKFNRDKYSELLTEARSAEINKWTPKEIDNFGGFLEDCGADERVGFLLYIIDNAANLYSKGVNTPSVKSLLRRFAKDLVRIKSINKDNKN
tara:strand:+ start:1023 stop:2423 length:1401 start_codon:yes stop_codon:yes gene_type:complete